MKQKNLGLAGAAVSDAGPHCFVDSRLQASVWPELQSMSDLGTQFPVLSSSLAGEKMCFLGEGGTAPPAGALATRVPHGASRGHGVQCSVIRETE